MRRDFGRAESALIADHRRGKRAPEAGLPSISSPPYPRVGFSDVLINAHIAPLIRIGLLTILPPKTTSTIRLIP